MFSESLYNERVRKSTPAPFQERGQRTVFSLTRYAIPKNANTNETIRIPKMTQMGLTFFLNR